MPKFEANINYIPPSSLSSMKQCNKSAPVTFHLELHLILRPGSNLVVVQHLIPFISVGVFKEINSTGAAVTSNEYFQTCTASKACL